MNKLKVKLPNLILNITDKFSLFEFFKKCVIINYFFKVLLSL